MALAAAVPILAVARHEAATGVLSTELRETGRPHVLANLALAMVSAAIAAALFLLVLLLIEGWRLTPIGAAIVVSVMPLVGPARQPLRQCGAERPGARRRWGDPRLRRPRRPGPAAQGGGGADRAAADDGRDRPRPGALGADRDRARAAAPRRRSTVAGRSPRATPASSSACLALTPIFTADIAEQRQRCDRRRHRRDPRLARVARC